MSADQDKHFLKTFSIVMVVLGVIAVIALITANVLVNMTESDAPYPEQVALAQQRTDPVYHVVTEASAAATSASQGAAKQNKTKSGKQIFKALCHTCHVPGLMGAPQVSNTAEWKKRYSKGIKTLYSHAINGFNAMPAKGGNSSLSDKEVKSAVDFILHKAGVK